MNPIDLTLARAALAECDAAPKPFTIVRVLCPEDHVLYSKNAVDSDMTQERADEMECRECPCPTDDYTAGVLAVRRIVSKTYKGVSPIMVGAEHLRAALAEVDRLNAILAAR